LVGASILTTLVQLTGKLERVEWSIAEGTTASRSAVGLECFYAVKVVVDGQVSRQ
jgi:hypothetical protein